MKQITQKELMKLENINRYRLQEIIDMGKGLLGDDAYYFECYEGKLYAGGTKCFQFIEKGFRSDYCLYKGKFYQL